MKRGNASNGSFLAGCAFLLLAGLPAEIEAQPLVERETAVSDPLPAGVLKRLGTIRGRHGSRVSCLAFAPTGNLLAAGGGDGPLCLWDSRNGQLFHSCDDTWVQVVVFSPDGLTFATAGAFKIIRLWDRATGKEIAQLKGHTAAIKALALSPNGRLLASAGLDGAIHLWEMPWGRERGQLQGHAEEVNALAFSPDNTLLASAGGDRTIRLWEMPSGRFLRQLHVPCTVTSLVFSPDGKKIFSGGDDNLVRIQDVASGQELALLKGHQGTVVSLSLCAGLPTPHTNNGQGLISGGHDGSSRFWDLAAKKEIRHIRRHLGDGDALALSPNGKVLATAGWNNTIRLFDVATGREIFWGKGHQAGITALALSPDGKQLASTTAKAGIRLWDTASGRQLRQWQAHAHGEVMLAWSADGQTFASSNGTEPVRFWDVATAREVDQLQRPAEEPGQCFALSPDGQWLAVGTRQQTIRLWNRRPKQVLHQLKFPGPVQALVFTADGKRLIAGGGGQFVVFEVTSGQEIKQFTSKEKPAAGVPLVACLAIAPDDKVLACGCYDGLVRLYDPAAGQEIGTLAGHGSAVYALAFSADGRMLASGSFDHTVRLWEVFSGTAIAVKKGHAGPVFALAVAPNGRSVYSGSADTNVLQWDVTGLGSADTLPSIKLSGQSLRGAWDNLAAVEASQAPQVLWYLAAAPKESVPFLASQVFLLDKSRLKQLFKDLNDTQFLVREKASQELALFGRWIENDLQKALQDPPSEEVRRRLNKLQQRLQVPGSPTLQQERFRYQRVMWILEQTGTPEARQLLQRMAQSAPEPLLCAEAQASLTRLGRMRK